MLAYGPSSALTLTSTVDSNSLTHVYLTMGAMQVANSWYESMPQVVSVDVTNTNSLGTADGTLLWTTQSTSANPDNPSIPKPAYGQFPLVYYGSHLKMIFTGKNYGPYVVGH